MSKRLKKLENDISKLREEIEALSKNAKMLERILKHGRGDEPTAIFDHEWYEDAIGLNIIRHVMRLYIDGREWTIEDKDGELTSFYTPKIESVTLSDFIATVVVDDQFLKEKTTYAIDYRRGTYVRTGFEKYGVDTEVKESE